MLTARGTERHAKDESKQGKLLELAAAQAAICHEPLDARLLRLALQEARHVSGGSRLLSGVDDAGVCSGCVVRVVSAFGAYEIRHCFVWQSSSFPSRPIAL